MYSCASKGPTEEKPPSVEIIQFESTVITPQVVKFQTKILIENRSSTDLDFDRVDYAVDLEGAELFTSSFDELLRTKRRGRQTVTFPFQISMKDIMDRSVEILAEGDIDVTFRGLVYPDPSLGYGPVRFNGTYSLPVPKMPEVALYGTKGVPLGGEFVVRLGIRNTNDFTITLHTIDSSLEINEVRYELLHSDETVELEPLRWEIVSLTMENTPGKTLSAVLNILQDPDVEFEVHGTIECKSTYGWIVIPFNI
jgi:LEA14-like dessication related protein